MLPLTDPSFARAARRLRYLFTDLDDTLTTQGKIPPEAFSAVWRLREAGIGVAIVSGRPAGWADHLARMWPVEGVIGENGAFYFRMRQGKLFKRYFHEPRRSQAVFEKIVADVAREVPGAKVSADQKYREFDLAIDFCEDVPPLPRADVLRIVEIFERHGARARVSSIHVNGWLEDFTKLTGCRMFAEEQLGLEMDELLPVAMFSGDSPNDEDLFHAFHASCAMANIADFADLLKRPPAFVTQRRGGQGFAEMAEAILAARNQ